MTSTLARHLRITGPGREARQHALAILPAPPLAVVDAHRLLRGPYTAAGTLARALVPEVCARRPDLVTAHDIEILSVAPELRELVPSRRDTLTSLAVPTERTRFYSRLRTLRLAHGLTELIRDSLDGGTGADGRSIVLVNVDAADPTDQEFVSVLLRRLDPARLTVVITTTTAADLPEPLGAAVDRYADRIEAPAGRVDSAPAAGAGSSPARGYVWSDGTSDDPAQLAAYQATDAADRAALHDARADELAATGDWSLRLGAIPYHRERGSDRAGAGARALRAALDYCIDMGFYESTVDFGERGRAAIDWADELDLYWVFTTKMTTSLAALGRPEEAEALYEEARTVSTSPSIHLQAAYATAMLYTRHHAEDRRDHAKAKAWINTAIAFAQRLPDPDERDFQTVFNRNGLALVEVHRGNLPAALRLVSDGLSMLDEQLGPDRHRLHRSVLRYNRAQVYAALGELDEALADYTAVISEDPNYSEYHFDRGNLLRRLGRNDEARAEYDAAIRCSPPYPEAHYNRADVLLELGETDRALAGFSYVLELDPDHTDAYVNRAGLLLSGGDIDAARADIRAGTALAPANPHLACLRGQLADHDGDLTRAEREYTAALAEDQDLAAAWILRASIRHSQGDTAGAVDDLDAALRLGPDPTAHYNRGVAHHGRGDWAGAIADFTAALHLLGTHDPDLLYQRGLSHLQAGDLAAARTDLVRAASQPDCEHHRSIQQLLVTLPAGGGS
jgi:tetratricopeptide (TPR) repeat protein